MASLTSASPVGLCLDLLTPQRVFKPHFFPIRSLSHKDLDSLDTSTAAAGSEEEIEGMEGEEALDDGLDQDARSDVKAGTESAIPTSSHAAPVLHSDAEDKQEVIVGESGTEGYASDAAQVISQTRKPRQDGARAWLSPAVSVFVATKFFVGLSNVWMDWKPFLAIPGDIASLCN